MKQIARALEYLACPYDKADLELGKNGLTCTGCGTTYEIRNGIPYFCRQEYEWETEAVKESIIETLGDEGITWAKVTALGPMFLNLYSDRKKAIDAVFRTVEDVVRATGQNPRLMQAATAARYDIELYRGTFTLPEEILQAIPYNPELVVEGACATGECLMQLKELDADFYIGLDISGNLLRQSEDENVLFVQGDITALPIKTGCAGLYVLNNVFDRVVDPEKASEEAGRVTGKKGALVLSNCNPLQFSYTTEAGDEIVFVQKDKQISLEQGMEIAGFSVKQSQSGIWNIETSAYGSEALLYISLLGERR